MFPNPMGETNNPAEITFWLIVIFVVIVERSIAARREKRKFKDVDQLAATDRKKEPRP